MPQSKSGIYSITNLTNGHRYIGSAVDVAKRFKEHRNALLAKRHHNAHLQRAWDKYGGESFIFDVVLECPPEMLLDAEQGAIDDLAPEYNICRAAGSVLGIRRSKETRARMSAAAKARGISPETRAKITAAITGKKRRPRTAEHQAKMTARLIGRIVSPETRAKMSVVRMGTPAWNRGIPNSPEARSKMAASHIGRPWTEAQRMARRPK